jgi:hypothetical protein
MTVETAAVSRSGHSCAIDSHVFDVVGTNSFFYIGKSHLIPISMTAIAKNRHVRSMFGISLPSCFRQHIFIVW